MTNAEQVSRPWLEQALLDPGSVFASPEAVVDHPAEIAVAEEEGMQGLDSDLLQRIILAPARPPGGGERVSARRRAACQCFIARPPLPCLVSQNSLSGMAPRKSLAWQEIWRKRAGVEPTRDRMAAPPGFEDRAPHRGTISSMFMRASSQALRLRDAARGRRGRGECSRCDRRTRESGSPLYGRRCHRQK